MTSSPDSSVAGDGNPATERATCQNCGHDADDHSVSWGCLAPVPDFEGWFEEPCGCWVSRLRILGDAS